MVPPPGADRARSGHAVSLLPVLSRWGTPIALALTLLSVAAPARAAAHNGFNLHPLWGSATPAQLPLPPVGWLEMQQEQRRQQQRPR